MKTLRLFVAAATILLAGCDPGSPPTPLPTLTPKPAASTSAPVPTPTPWYSPSPTPSPEPTSTQVVVIPSATPTGYNGPQVLAMSAYDFSRGAGANIHIDHTDGVWANQDYMLHMVESMMFGAVRTSLTILSNPSYVTKTNQFIDNGIDVDLLTDSASQTPQSIMNYLKLLDPYGKKWIEGPNELDVCCNDSQWIIDDDNVMKNGLKPAQVAEGANTLGVIGPSLVFGDPRSLGDLSNYEDFTNMHDYMQGYPPENKGYGGGYFGYIYGDDLGDIAAAQSVTAKPTAATEFGYSTYPNIQNAVTEYTQADYLERQFLNHALLGVTHQYMYDLFDEGNAQDGYWGIVRPDGSQKPSAFGLQGMLNILHDTKPAASPCYIPVTIKSPASTVRYAAFCKSSGEYDIAIWDTSEVEDPNNRLMELLPVVSASISIFNNPSRVVQWNQDSTFHWSYNEKPDTANLVPSDRVSFIQVNGPKPAAIPALPTPPPIN